MGTLVARGRRPAVAIGLGLLVVVAALGATLATSREHALTGVVIDLNGKAITGATVRLSGDAATSDQDGRFALRTGARDGWVRGEAPGFLPRIRPAMVGEPIVLRLTPDDGQTISLVFGGDVMFGRRFFDPNEDGNRVDGLIQPGSGVADYARLLDGVQPALAAADLAVVNLETPLLASAYVDPTMPRPSGFHPSKEFVFGSLPLAAKALQLVGVDVAGIGNNHLYDGLDAGVRETLAALDEAGFAAGSGRAGGGSTEAEAWAPAILDVHGTTVAIVACTTIDGHETPPTYVALSTAKGGAALCTEVGIRTAVAAARAKSDLVVAMIHGGYEYDRSPTERIRQLSATARAAGAALVVNHHPHVIGGFEQDAGSVTAWTIGNLLFDQTVWPTFESYLLTVQVRDGKVIRAIVDPLIIDAFRPHPITGELAMHVARDAAGWAPGSFVIEDGAVEIRDPAEVTQVRGHAALTGTAGGSILQLTGATAIDPTGATGDIEAGRDLLWSGDFEDAVVDGDDESAPLWLADAPGRERLAAAAWRGDAGIRLERAGSKASDVILAPIHRVLVTAGTHLTFVAKVRQSGGSTGSVQLSWFNDLKGDGSAQTVVDIPGGEGWQTVRIDVTVPEHAVAVLPIIRLGAPNAGRVTLDVDDERLIAWGAVADATLATDYLRVRGAVAFDTFVATLPGPGSSPSAPVMIADAEPATVDQPGPLPPGPSLAPVDQ